MPSTLSGVQGFHGPQQTSGLLDTRHSPAPPPRSMERSFVLPRAIDYVIIVPPATLLFIASIHTQLSMATHILFESASGYAIFEVKLRDELASMTEAVQKSIQDLGKFKKMVTLLSFSPFKNAAHALENANDVSEGA